MITEKFLKAYRAEYEKAKTIPGAGAFPDEDAYLAEYIHTYEKYIKNESSEHQILLWLTMLRSPEKLGFRKAFATDDMALLNDALFQAAVFGHARRIWASGCDHCANVWTVFTVLAAGLAERVPLLLPEELGVSGNGHPVSVAITNLLMALWYRREDFEAAGRKKAEKTLNTKQTATDHAAIRYLLALSDGNLAEASAQLDLYCRGVPRVQEFGVTKLDKLFWPRAHGLYNLAFAVWGKDKAEAIAAPEQDCFCGDLARWQIEHDFHPGKLFLEYPAPMDLVNRILLCTPPAYTLHQPYLHAEERENTILPKNRKQYTAHAELFKERLVTKVLEELAHLG
jgi:hypothetical protein